MAMLWVYAGPIPERIVVAERCATDGGEPLAMTRSARSHAGPKHLTATVGRAVKLARPVGEPAAPVKPAQA